MERRHTVDIQQRIIEDKTLIQEALAGSQQAFAILVEHYSSYLFRVISRYIGDYDTARDVLQEVFLQLYLSLPTLRTDGPIKPWLTQVARSRSIDELRRQRRTALPHALLETRQTEEETLMLLEIVDPAPQPEEYLEQCEIQRDLQQAIQSLPPKFRSIVWLRYRGERSFVEIGRELGIPIATAKTYYFRAIPLLRTWYAQMRNASSHPAETPKLTVINSEGSFNPSDALPGSSSRQSS